MMKGSCVDVYEVESGQVGHSIDFKEHVSSLTFITVCHVSYWVHVKD